MIEAPGVELAKALIVAATWYGYAGTVFAALFLSFGIDRIDPASRGSYLFRLLLLPATIALWPLVLWRWTVRARDGEAS